VEINGCRVIESSRLASPRIYCQKCISRSRPSAPAPPSPDDNPYEEFVIEQLLSHGVDDGNIVMRVRSFGFGSDDDTWEPITHLPKLLVERYAKRNKMAIEDLWPNRQ
jgi:hypothetical protein